jgi:hypothetical protein
MPICFQLYDKSKPEEGPVSLSKVDEEMCEHFQVPCDPIKYLGGWFDCIGFRLALGKTFEEIREQIDGYLAADKQHQDGYVEFYENMLLMLSYLEERYTPNAFYSPIKD